MYIQKTLHRSLVRRGTLCTYPLVLRTLHKRSQAFSGTQSSLHTHTHTHTHLACTSALASLAWSPMPHSLSYGLASAKICRTHRRRNKHHVQIPQIPCVASLWSFDVDAKQARGGRTVRHASSGGDSGAMITPTQGDGTAKGGFQFIGWATGDGEQKTPPAETQNTSDRLTPQPL